MGRSIRRLFIMRNPYRAAADEFADDGVAGNDVVRRYLFHRQALDALQQVADMVVTNPRIEKAGVWLDVLRLRQQAFVAQQERTQRRQVEGKSAVDANVRQAVEWNDAEQFAGADVMPVQDRPQ